MAGTRRLSQLVESALPRLDLPEGDLIVALSGGADSAALAFLCIEAGRRPGALHVNHGLTHSPLMEKAAMGIAQKLEIDLETRAVEVSAGPSPEGQARRVRYRAFAQAAEGGGRVLTGHTLDDNAETILLNLIRGTGPRGLSGIPSHHPAGVFRPILHLERSETREIADLAGLTFVDDPMNDDPTLTRNWLRSVIFPQLRQLNPRLAEALQRTGDLIEADDALLQALSEASPPTLGDGRARVPRSALMARPRPVADRVLVRMLSHVIGDANVTSDRVGRLWSVVRGETASQEMGHGVVATIDGPMLSVSTGEDAPPAIGGLLTPGSHSFGGLEFDVRAMSGPCRALPLSRWAAVFPPDVELQAGPDGVVTADGRTAWVPGQRRLPVAWYEPGSVGYLSVFAREETEWTSSR